MSSGEFEQDWAWSLRDSIVVGMLLMMGIAVVSAAFAGIAMLFGADFMVAFAIGVGFYFTVYAMLGILIWMARRSVRKERVLAQA